MKSRHGGTFQSRSLFYNIHYQAKEIIYNITRYFIAEKVNKLTLIHGQFAKHIRLGNAAYFMAPQQLERGSLYLSFKIDRL